MKGKIWTSIAVGLMVAAWGTTYPSVDSSGATLGRWTSDLESAVEQSKSTGRPIVVCTVHECQDACGAMLTRIASDIASQSYLVCLNRDSGYPGYRSDFLTLMQRYANSSSIGQTALLYGGRRAGEVAVKYGTMHSLVAVTNALAKMRGDYASVVACSSANAAVQTMEYSAILTTNKLSFTTSSPVSWQQSGEASNFENTSYSTGRSVRSGLIGDEEESWIKTTIVGPAKGSFRWMVSSEDGYDTFSFKIDDRTVKTISGDRGINADSWSTIDFSVGSGQHTLTWIYEKDGSVSAGFDGGWLADLRIGGGWSHDGDDVQGDVIRGADWLSIDGDSEMWCSLGEGFEHEAIFDIDSGSTIKTVSVTGLPAGLRFDSKTRMVSGTLTRRGVYWVTITAKNAGGYSHSLVQTWYVDADDNGDYDDIGLDDYFDVGELENLRAGEMVEICTLMKSVTGLPTGLKFTAGSKCSTEGLCTSCSGFISGMPTKAGKFKISFTDYQGRKAVKTVVVGSHGSALFSAESPNEGRGTVRGTAVYAIGAKISLNAMAKSGYYFAGWYCDSSFEVPFDYGDKDYRNASLPVVFDWNMAQDQRVAYARFVSKWEDSNLYIDCPGYWEVDTTYTGDRIDFFVDSLTVPTVTMKGLPTGIKYDNARSCLYVANQSQLKPGLYAVTITAKNKSGATDVATVTVRVPNLKSWMIWDYDGDEAFDYDGAYYLYVGQWADCCSASQKAFNGPVDLPMFETYSSARVTASGLPPGIKLYNERSSEGNWYGFTGAATKAGTYTVTLTITEGKLTEKATFTIVVEPFPTSLMGQYNGTLTSSSGRVEGLLSLTIDGKGVVSAKITCRDEMLSLKGYLFSLRDDGMASLYLHDSKWNALSLDIDFFGFWEDVQMTGSFESETRDESFSVSAQRNPFGKVGGTWENAYAHHIAQRLASYGRINLASFRSSSWEHDFELVGAACTPSTTVPMSVTVKQDGTVSLAGKLGGDYSMSGSGVLRYDGDHGYPYVDLVVNVQMQICTICCGPNGRPNCRNYKQPVHIHLEFLDWDKGYCCPFGYADEIR